MRGWLTVSIAALALSACGSEKEGTLATEDGDVSYTIDDADGGKNISLSGPEGEATVETGEDIKPDLPAGVMLYPGASVESVSNVGLENGASGALVSMKSTDSPDKVAAWYKAEAVKAGFTPDAQLQTGKLHVFSAKAPDGRQFSVTATERDGGSSIQLIAGSGTMG